MPSAALLIVEDDETDALILRKAFDRILANCALQVAADGLEAKRYLLGDGQFGDRTQYPLPTVILLDLRMPNMDGFAFLEWIRSASAYRLIPTVVYSASDDPSDIRRAYELGANAVMHKKLSSEAVHETMRTFARYWLEDCSRLNIQWRVGGQR
jgi:CheY-like chemotaxis protein